MSFEQHSYYLLKLLEMFIFLSKFHYKITVFENYDYSPRFAGNNFMSIPVLVKFEFFSPLHRSFEIRLEEESVTKYKCSIIQTEQNTTKRNKIQHDKIKKCQNINTTKYKRTKYKLPKYKSNKIQVQ